MQSIDKLHTRTVLSQAKVSGSQGGAADASFAAQLDDAAERIRQAGVASGKMLDTPAPAPSNAYDVVGGWLQAMNAYHLQNNMSTASDMELGINYVVEMTQRQQAGINPASVDPQTLLLDSIQDAAKAAGRSSVVQDVQQFFDANGISLNVSKALAALPQSSGTGAFTGESSPNTKPSNMRTL